MSKSRYFVKKSTLQLRDDRDFLIRATLYRRGFLNIPFRVARMEERMHVLPETAERLAGDLEQMLNDVACRMEALNWNGRVTVI